ncbi:hypothetical protein D9756_010018 [Leucocoprinus leucothites]|uniref:F-box domain-containing protein n=1 Tax=Leucocoprinus leucothites TaxID=201217 RepID=A0A8H5CT07_9AGAR|nr:hypothetical protein D9756_010018 [Leucoagaricus leucothites]
MPLIHQSLMSTNSNIFDSGHLLVVTLLAVMPMVPIGGAFNLRITPFPIAYVHSIRFNTALNTNFTNFFPHISRLENRNIIYSFLSSPDLQPTMDLRSGTSIPQELLDLITEQAQHDIRTILNLCLVSQSFCSSARSVLYRRIRVVTFTSYKLNRYGDPQIVNIDGCTRFLTTIAIYNPRLGRYIHEFYYAPENGSRQVRFWELMNQALYHMVNLKIFSFRNFVSPSKRALFWGTKFQLEEFYWDDGYSIDFDGEMAWFLKTQPQLRVLAAPLSNQELHAPHLPRLRTFIGDEGSIKRLFYSNTVERLRWRGSLSPLLNGTVGCRNSFLAALTKLRVLSIGGPHINPFMPTLTPYLHSLEVLHTDGLHDTNEVRSEFVYIQRLKSLRVLILSLQPLHQAQSYGKDEQEKIVRDCFNDGKHLEAVYFCIRSSRRGEKDGFSCWARGGLTPVIYTWEELAERESLHEFAPLLDSSRLDFCTFLYVLNIMSEPNDTIFSRDEVDPGSSDLAEIISEAEEQMAELDSEILVLQEDLSQLQRKKTRLRTFTSYCSNLKAPIACLPAETLLEVFSQFLPESGVYIGCRAPLSTRGPTIFQLSAICFSWRNLLLSQPLFWSKVMLSLPHSETSVPTRTLDIVYANALTRLNLCYRRAGDMLMSLTLEAHGDPPGSNSLNALLRKLAFGPQRWERMEIHDTLFNVSHWMGHVGYSNLRVLSIRSGDGDDPALNRALQTLGSRAPQLSSLSLEVDAKNWGVDPETRIFDLSLIPTQITKLNVTISRLSSSAHAAVLYDMIRQHPGLSKLQIRVLGSSWQVIPPTSQRDRTNLPSFSLSSLTSLDLSWGPTGNVTEVLFKFIPQNLRTLTLHISKVAGRDVSQELLDWARHFALSLRSANLVWRTGSTKTVLPLIDAWTGITNLELQGPGVARALEFLSTKLSSSQFAHAPKLKTLAVHLREDAKEAFLAMMSQRLSKNITEDSRLALVTIEATEGFIRGIRHPLLALIQTSGYICRVQYEIDRSPWLKLGLDEPMALNIPTFSD